MNRPSLVLSAIGMLGVLASAGATAGPKSSGTNAGVYSADQADAGRRLYGLKCALCHGADLMGTVETPGLKGKFVANWGRKPLFDMFDYVQRSMPQSAPRTLDSQQTANIVAYLLQSNGYPAGAKALSTENSALQRVILDGRKF